MSLRTVESRRFALGADGELTIDAHGERLDPLAFARIVLTAFIKTAGIGS